MAEVSDSTKKLGAWLGVISGVIAVLAFFGITNFGQLRHVLAPHGGSSVPPNSVPATPPSSPMPSVSASMPISMATWLALRDPCAALSRSTMDAMGFGAARSSNGGEGINAYRSCDWPASGGDSLEVAYNRLPAPVFDPSINVRLDGIPNSVITDPDQDTCTIYWPTSFGRVEITTFGTSAPHPCALTEKLARQAYPKLSR